MKVPTIVKLDPYGVANNFDVEHDKSGPKKVWYKIPDAILPSNVCKLILVYCLTFF